MTASPPPAPREPREAGWIRIGPMDQGYGYRWCKGKLSVVSSIDVAELPDGSGTGPQWHVSVMFKLKRPSDDHVKAALRAFGFWGQRYDEDNHHPGDARHFFLVVDPAHRVACACKSDEDVIVEPDGYAWTTPKAGSGEECRGCEWERISRKLYGAARAKPCPIHGKEVASA